MGLSRASPRGSQLALFPLRTNDRHFHIRGVPRRSNYVERALRYSLEIKIPFSGSRSYDDAGNSAIEVIRMNQLVVRSVRQMLIAKDHVDCLPRQHFLGLRLSGARN